MTPPGTVTAIAHPNIALAKYWGKKPGDGNVPAVPSLSITLAGLATRTSVTFDGALEADIVSLNGAVAEGRAAARVTALLDRVRELGGSRTFARVESANDFPTASGLASSASGFAALALSATRAAGLDWPEERVADLARLGSVSAARSIFGGFVELVGTTARRVAPPSALDLCVLVAVTTEAPKATSSSEGMRTTQDASPYYASWLALAPPIFEALRAALLARDFSQVGALAERSALAMHACALAGGLVYVSGATLAALREVRTMRASGLEAYATIDAGPHLKCLVRTRDADHAKERLAATPGVLRVIVATPGEGARIVAGDDSSDAARGTG